MEKEMDEGRKRTIGVIATMFACKKLAALEPRRTCRLVVPRIRENVEAAQFQP